MDEVQDVSREAIDTGIAIEQCDQSIPRGMIFIPGGSFRMGSDQHYPEERCIASNTEADHAQLIGEQDTCRISGAGMPRLVGFCVPFGNSRSGSNDLDSLRMVTGN